MVNNYKIGIVDYSLGNLYNIERSLKYLGYTVKFIQQSKDLENIDGLILPGVGSFSVGMQNLKKSNLDQGIQNFVKSGKPLLGICLGMQLLMTNSFEFGNHKGLNLIEGTVEKIVTDNNLPLPHIGWANCSIKSKYEYQMFSHLDETADFYFTHSYVCVPKDLNNIFGTFNYGKDLTSIIVKNNIIGCQFHPELSSYAGLEILKNIKNL